MSRLGAEMRKLLAVLVASCGLMVPAIAEDDGASTIVSAELGASILHLPGYSDWFAINPATFAPNGPPILNSPNIMPGFGGTLKLYHMPGTPVFSSGHSMFFALNASLYWHGSNVSRTHGGAGALGHRIARLNGSNGFNSHVGSILNVKLKERVWLWDVTPGIGVKFGDAGSETKVIVGPTILGIYRNIRMHGLGLPPGTPSTYDRFEDLNGLYAGGTLAVHQYVPFSDTTMVSLNASADLLHMNANYSGRDVFFDGFATTVYPTINRKLNKFTGRIKAGFSVKRHFGEDCYLVFSGEGSYLFDAPKIISATGATGSGTYTPPILTTGPAWGATARLGVLKKF